MKETPEQIEEERLRHKSRDTWESLKERHGMVNSPRRRNPHKSMTGPTFQLPELALSIMTGEEWKQ